MENPLVSVILPTFNRMSMVEASVESVMNQNYDNLELIIVNDCSSDGTAEVLQAFTDSRIKIFHNRQRLGLPASRNKGVLQSHGALIFFSEDDLTLKIDCISRLVDSYRRLSSKKYLVGAVGPRLITIDHHLSKVNLPMKGKHLVEISPITGFVKINFDLNTLGPVIVKTLHSCSLIPKAGILKVGGYETNLYKGSYVCEETDFYLRLQKEGYTLFFDPSSVVEHRFGKVGGCILPSRLSQEYYNIRNHLFYLTRFYGIFTPFMFPCFLFEKLVLR
jgi:glycosyltransferase involved in cell wall biosynthesis